MRESNIPSDKKKYFWIIFFSLVNSFPPSLFAGININGELYKGDRRYVEKKLSVVYQGLPPFIERQNSPPSSVLIGFQRIGYEREMVNGTSFSNNFFLGMEFLEGFYFKISYHLRPSLSDEPGAYGSQGWDVNVGGEWDSNLFLGGVFKPARSIPFKGGASLTFGNKTHHERIQSIPFRLKWTSVKEQYSGGKISGSFYNKLTLKVGFKIHSYEADLNAKLKNFEWFLLQDSRSSASYKELSGFLKSVWTFRVHYGIRENIFISGGWEKLKYITNANSQSDFWDIKVSYVIKERFSIFGKYLYLIPKSQDNSKYMGMGVGIKF